MTQNDTVDVRTIPTDVVRNIYRTVALIAAADARLRRGLSAGEFRCSYYPVRGQEMIPAGAVQALRNDDFMVTTYRGVHDVIAKGVPLREMMAEFFGRVDGTSKGKGGPMHLSDPNSGMMVTTGIVGGGVPIANGLALACQMQGSDRVTMVSFGDGSTSIGGVHEAFNMAALWDLPVIFMLQNNQYGEHTPIEEFTKTERLSDRAKGYGMKGVTIDGNDPIAVMNAVQEAADRARSGGGPTLIEAVTYRLLSHSFGATTSYMEPEALKAAWEADPIPRFRNRLIEGGVFDADALDALDAEAAELIEDAVQYGLANPQPPLGELLIDVFHDEKDVVR